jgi:hypothetical protein
VARPSIADKEDSTSKHEAADGTRPAFKHKAEKVKHDEHGMVVEECWIDRLWQQQNRYQPLQTVHVQYLTSHQLRNMYNER